MALTRAKRMWPVAYYLYIDAKSYQAGQAVITQQIRAVCIDERGGEEARGLGNRCSIHLSYGAVRLMASVYNAAVVFWLYMRQKPCQKPCSTAALHHAFLIPNTE
jgi:hypothetical protein